MAGTITHSWNGTVLTVTSDSGSSSADLKGAKGDTGARGIQGISGDALTDTSLSKAGFPADAAEVGDLFSRLIIKHITEKGTNIDDYKTQGIYYITSATYAPTGLPNGAVNGWLIVLTQTESSIKDGVLRMYKQIFMRSGTVNNTDKDFYYRMGKITVENVESWGDWYKVISSKDYAAKTITPTLAEQTTYTINSLNVYTRNGITDIRISATPTAANSSWVTVATITSGLPAENIYADMPHWDFTAGYKNIRLRVLPSGAIQLSVGEPNHSYVFHDTYINVD